MADWQETLVADLEKLGESEVRAKYIRLEWGQVGSDRSAVVKNWLESGDSLRRTTSEEETLSLARAAKDLSEGSNYISREANSIAVCTDGEHDRYTGNDIDCSYGFSGGAYYPVLLGRTIIDKRDPTASHRSISYETFGLASAILSH
jgi:hypothetical protein